MTLPLKVKGWFNDRGITDPVIEANHLDWNDNQIVIPIYDTAGEFLFNKYRRDPFGPDNLSKYKYQAGSSTQLYNVHKIKDSQKVILLEGEFDALRLEVEGFTAISSTGGAGSFKDEWLPFLIGKEVYVCYDNDHAGLQGAIKVLTKIDARWVLLPREKNIKDVTDFLKNHPIQDFHNLLILAENYPILSEPLPEFKFIKDIRERIKKYKNFLQDLRKKEQIIKNSGQAFYHFDYIRQPIFAVIKNLELKIRKLNFTKRPTEGGSGRFTNDDLRRAKEVSLEILYGGQLRKQGGRSVGLCPFHNETGASFTIYSATNKFWCYGCNQGGDSVSFIQKRDNCDFITAVKKLLNK